MDKQVDVFAAVLALWRTMAVQASALDEPLVYLVGKKDETMSAITLANKINTGAISEQVSVRPERPVRPERQLSEKADDFVAASVYYAQMLEKLQAMQPESDTPPDTTVEEIEEIAEIETPTPVEEPVETTDEAAEEIPEDTKNETVTESRADIPVVPISMKKVALVSGLITLGLVLLTIVVSFINSMMQITANQTYARNAPFELSPGAWGVIAAMVGVGLAVWLVFIGLWALLAKLRRKARSAAAEQEGSG